MHLIYLLSSVSCGQWSDTSMHTREWPSMTDVLCLANLGNPNGYWNQPIWFLFLSKSIKLSGMLYTKLISLFTSATASSLMPTETQTAEPRWFITSVEYRYILQRKTFNDWSKRAHKIIVSTVNTNCTIWYDTAGLLQPNYYWDGQLWIFQHYVIN